jgi:folate-binding protein YgfZ
MESGVVLIASPGLSSILTTRLSKYITAFDKVAITDITSSTHMFSLIGPQSNNIMSKIAATDLIDSPAGSHKVFGFKNTPVVAFSGLNSSAACGGLPGPGYTLICEESTAPDLWRVLIDNDAIPLGEAGWEVGRVVHGRPVPGKELTDEYNPLEAGLYHAISLNKGCYMGQETLSKVYTQGAVKRQLWGLDLEAPCSPGDAVWPLHYKKNSGTTSTRPLGIVTSYADTPYAEKKALAYLRCKVDGVVVNYYNMDVIVVGKDEREKDGGGGGGGVRGRVVSLAYTNTDFLPGTAPNKVLKKNNNIVSVEAATTNEADEAEKKAELARQEKLRKMQERLAAWQQQQQQQQDEEDDEGDQQ